MTTVAEVRTGTMVGDVLLPDLPPGTPVSWDTETSGLFVDGDPGTATQYGAPRARMSMVSVAWKDPKTGEIISHAWPFDQGPIIGKQGRPRRDPDTGRQYFDLIDQKTHDAICAKFPEYTPEEICFNYSADEYRALMEWLAQRDLLVAHNGKFDQHIGRAGMRRGAGGNVAVPEGLHAIDLSATCNWERSWMRLDRTPHHPPQRRVYDTQLVQVLIDPKESTALKPTSARLRGEDQTEAQEAVKAALKLLGVGLGKRYDLIPTPINRLYAAKDAEQTLWLYYWQQACAEEGAIPPVFDFLVALELDLMQVLYRMEKKGCPYNREESLQASEVLRAKMDEIAAKLPFNPRKPAEPKHYYFGKVEEGGMGLIPTEVTEKKREAKLDAAEVRKLAGEQRPFAHELEEFTHCKSAISKWYDGWGLKVGEDGRLRANFRQGRIEADRPGQSSGGAISGRLSVERFQSQAAPRSVNLPVEVPSPKGLIKPPTGSGKRVWEADLPNGEVRIVTALSNCKPLWDIIDRGGDMHSQTCELMFKVTKDNPDFKRYRQASKATTFGSIFEAGAETLQEQMYQQTGIRFPLADVKMFIDTFRKNFPEIKRMSNGAIKKGDPHTGLGYVTLVNGRRRHFHWSERIYTAALSACVQGGLAEVCKEWMIRVDQEEPGILINQVHDSLMVEVDDTPEGEAQAQRVAKIGQQVYEKAFSLRGRHMPFPMEAEPYDSKE